MSVSQDTCADDDNARSGGSEGVSKKASTQAGIRTGTSAPLARDLEWELLTVASPGIGRAQVRVPRLAWLGVPQEALQGWVVAHSLRVEFASIKVSRISILAQSKDPLSGSPQSTGMR